MAPIKSEAHSVAEGVYPPTPQRAEIFSEYKWSGGKRDLGM